MAFVDVTLRRLEELRRAVEDFRAASGYVPKDVWDAAVALQNALTRAILTRKGEFEKLTPAAQAALQSKTRNKSS